MLALFIAVRVLYMWEVAKQYFWWLWSFEYKTAKQKHQSHRFNRCGHRALIEAECHQYLVVDADVKHEHGIMHIFATLVPTTCEIGLRVKIVQSSLMKQLSTNCYFCIKPPIRQGISKRNKTTITYLSIPSAIRRVPQWESLHITEQQKIIHWIVMKKPVMPAIAIQISLWKWWQLSQTLNMNWVTS